MKKKKQKIEIEGKALHQLAREAGIKYATFYNRIKYSGWTIEQALYTPVHHHSFRDPEKFSEIQRNKWGVNVTHWARQSGLSFDCVRQRMKKYNVDAETAAQMILPEDVRAEEIKAAAKKYNLSKSLIRSRMRQTGCTADEAGQRGKQLVSLQQVAAENNISYRKILYLMYHRTPTMSRDEAIKTLIDNNDQYPKKKTVNELIVDAGLDLELHAGKIKYLIWYHQMTPDEAIKTVKEKLNSNENKNKKKKK